MKKKIIIFSIISILILILVNFSSGVGYQFVKTSQDELIEGTYSFNYCKDYLFETLVEISENPEVKDIIKDNYRLQKIILPFRRNNVELKIEHLELFYEMGLKIIDRLGEERVEELMENIEIGKPEYLDKLEAVILGNEELKVRFYNLNEMNAKSEKIDWDFPVICSILYILCVFTYGMGIIPDFLNKIMYINWILYLLLFYPLMFFYIPLVLINLVFFTFYALLCMPVSPQIIK